MSEEVQYHIEKLRRLLRIAQMDSNKILVREITEMIEEAEKYEMISPF